MRSGWLRWTAAAIVLYWIWGQLRVRRGYAGLAPVAGQYMERNPRLLSLAVMAAIRGALTLAAIVFTRWPATITYFVGIAALSMIEQAYLKMRGLPPFEDIAPGGALESRRPIAVRVAVTGAVLWTALALGSAIWFGL